MANIEYRNMEDLFAFIILMILLLFILRLLFRRSKDVSTHIHDALVAPKKKYRQGYYKPRYPEKYRGDTEDIIYRSGWELVVFEWCDFNPYILAWASEELIIEYYMKGVPYPRHYYPDLLIHFERGETFMVEIKPSDQRQEPNYKNRCKWAAARAYCREKGWKFRVWDEKTIDRIRAKARYWRLNRKH